MGCVLAPHMPYFPIDCNPSVFFASPAPEPVVSLSGRKCLVSGSTQREKTTQEKSGSPHLYCPVLFMKFDNMHPELYVINAIPHLKRLI